MTIEDGEKLKKELLNFYITFSRKPPAEQQDIINDYDTFLTLSSTSRPAKLYKQTRQALKERNYLEVKRLSAIAREMLANEEYKQSPQKFDPKFIHNHPVVMAYRHKQAETLKLIDPAIKEALL